MIAGSVVGAATLYVSILMQWKFVALPTAVLTNRLAAMTVGLPLLRGTIDNPGQIIAALIAFAAVWLAIIFREKQLSIFEIVESALLLAIGAGGTAIIAGASHQYAIPLATLYAAAAIAAFVKKWQWLALYLVTLAALLTLDLRSVTGTVARIVLLSAVIKLIVEDVRVERAAMLAISFVSCGLAMLVVARCVRRHTSHVHQSLGTPADDTFGSSPGDQTV